MERLPDRVRVVESYVEQCTDPLRFHTGDVLRLGHRDRQWPAYVWGTDKTGRSGWVPESYITLTGEHEATALRDYDATEITVTRGEELTVLDEAGGWLLCSTSSGRRGWVPATHVEPAWGPTA
jgi:hypothetical protein